MAPVTAPRNDENYDSQFSILRRSMRAIDIHAHLTPQCFQQAVLAGQTWHGMTSVEGELFNPLHCWQ